MEEFSDSLISRIEAVAGVHGVFIKEADAARIASLVRKQPDHDQTTIVDALVKAALISVTNRRRKCAS